jgi:hypothetical protein
MTIEKSPQYIADMKLELDPTAPERLFCLSFFDPTQTPASSFVGVMLVIAKSITGALLASHFFHIPGGAVRVGAMAEQLRAALPTKWLDRFLAPPEVDELNEELAKLLPTMLLN